MSKFIARKTASNDCVSCHHQKGIWRDTKLPERWLCDDCFAAYLEQLDASERAALKQYRAMGLCH